MLRVNDRGPFVGNRIIDISKRGAQLLGFQNQGTAKVRVEVMKEESKRLKQALLNKEDIQIAIKNTPAPAPTAYTSAGDKIQAIGAEAKYARAVASEKKKYFVQAGAFSNQEIAGRLEPPPEQHRQYGNVADNRGRLAFLPRPFRAVQ